MKNLPFTKLLATLSVATSLASSACYSTRVVAHRGGGDVVHKPFHPNVVLGLYELEPIDIDRECGSGGGATFHSQISTAGWFIGAFTNGIFTPVDATLECSTASQLNAPGTTY